MYSAGALFPVYYYTVVLLSREGQDHLAREITCDLRYQKYRYLMTAADEIPSDILPG